jgi:hypothetical protein
MLRKNEKMPPAGQHGKRDHAHCTSLHDRRSSPGGQDGCQSGEHVV